MFFSILGKYDAGWWHCRSQLKYWVLSIWCNEYWTLWMCEVTIATRLTENVGPQKCLRRVFTRFWADEASQRRWYQHQHYHLQWDRCPKMGRPTFPFITSFRWVITAKLLDSVLDSHACFFSRRSSSKYEKHIGSLFYVPASLYLGGQSMNFLIHNYSLQEDQRNNKYRGSLHMNLCMSSQSLC